MYSGDPRFFDSNKQVELGMEARSILKSIRTEESKLVSSPNVSSSDLYYFRARHNYYKLSLLRLSQEERSAVEPDLARFQQKIANFEEGASKLIKKEKVTPFLEAVEPQKNGVKETPKSLEIDSDENSRNSSSEMKSQLSLIRLALSSDLSISSKQVVIEGLDRLIAKL